MTAEYLPFIFGFTRLLLGLAIFSKVFKVFGNNDSESVFVKRKSLMTLLAAFLIVSGFYTLVFADTDSYKISNHTSKGWTDDDKRILIETCLRDGGTIPKEHPRAANEYCECSSNKVMAVYSKTEYLTIIKERRPSQVNAVLKDVQECLKELQRQVESEKAVQRR